MGSLNIRWVAAFLQRFDDRHRLSGEDEVVVDQAGDDHNLDEHLDHVTDVLQKESGCCCLVC